MFGFVQMLIIFGEDIKECVNIIHLLLFLKVIGINLCSIKSAAQIMQ